MLIFWTPRLSGWAKQGLKIKLKTKQTKHPIKTSSDPYFKYNFYIKNLNGVTNGVTNLNGEQTQEVYRDALHRSLGSQAWHSTREYNHDDVYENKFVNITDQTSDQ